MVSRTISPRSLGDIHTDSSAEHTATTSPTPSTVPRSPRKRRAEQKNRRNTTPSALIFLHSTLSFPSEHSTLTQPSNQGSDRGWPYLSLFLQFLKKSATKPLGFLAARALANAFSQPTNQFALLQYRQQVLPSIAQTIATHGEALHKNCKVALATMLLNYAVSVRERQDSAGDVAGVVLELLPAVKAEPEAVGGFFRILL